MHSEQNGKCISAVVVDNNTAQKCSWIKKLVLLNDLIFTLIYKHYLNTLFILKTVHPMQFSLASSKLSSKILSSKLSSKKSKLEAQARYRSLSLLKKIFKLKTLEQAIKLKNVKQDIQA